MLRKIFNVSYSEKEGRGYIKNLFSKVIIYFYKEIRKWKKRGKPDSAQSKRRMRVIISVHGQHSTYTHKEGGTGREIRGIEYRKRTH